MAERYIEHDYDSGWLKLSSTTTTGDFYYRKKGGMLFFQTNNCSPVSTLPLGESVNVGNLAIDFRPSKHLTFISRCSNGVGICTVGSDGNVFLGNYPFGINPGSTMWASGCFIQV